MSHEPEDTSILLTAFRGTAAFNTCIGGCTIHHAFFKQIMPIPYEPLKEQSLSPTSELDLKICKYWSLMKCPWSKRNFCITSMKD